MASPLRLALLATSAMAACNYGTSFYPREPQVVVSSFSYAGLTGPLNWYEINKTANALCAEGKSQSPINFSAKSFAKHSVKLTLPEYAKGAILENLGTNVEVVANGTLEVDGDAYKLAQFHFHTPAEHRVDGEYYPMEVHFLFEDEHKNNAVVAFLVELGAADPLLTSVFTYVSDIPSPGNATLTGPLVFEDLKNHFENNKIFQYSGSLTTPPCSENVKWFISGEPLYIDADTYKKVKQVVRFNARYTQNDIGHVNLLENIAHELH